jgi:arylsulfatase A-like enzyme
MFPTLTELAGVPMPDYLEGTSMVPLLSTPERPWKKAAFSQFPRGLKLEGYAMRTERHRYVEWWNKERDGARVDVAAIELYDCAEDPMETTNVAGLPENKERVAQLSAQLEAGWRSALPDGIENRSKNAPAPPAVPWSPKRARKPRQKKDDNPL